MGQDYWEIAILEIRQAGPRCAAAFNFIHGNLVRTVMEVSCDSEAARDIAAQCVLEVIETIDIFGTPSANALRRKARYLAQAWQEKERHRILAEGNFVHEVQASSAHTDAAELSDLRQRVSRMAAVLEPALEKAAIMYLVYGYSLEQVSLVLGKPRDKIKLDLIRAVHWLRKLASAPCPIDIAYLRHRRRISDAS